MFRVSGRAIKASQSQVQFTRGEAAPRLEKNTAAAWWLQLEGGEQNKPILTPPKSSKTALDFEEHQVLLWPLQSLCTGICYS